MRLTSLLLAQSTLTNLLNSSRPKTQLQPWPVVIKSAQLLGDP